MSIERGHERLYVSLAAFALGALPHEECLELEVHLDACEDCRDTLSAYNQQIEHLVGEVSDPPGVVWERIRRRIRQPRRGETPDAGGLVQS